MLKWILREIGWDALKWTHLSQNVDQWHTEHGNERRIRGSHIGGYDDYYILGYNAV
jgi:hypothetical protein